MAIDQTGIEVSGYAVKDLGKVTQKATSGRFRHLEGRIASGTANVHQIREWYMSKDPLGEDEVLRVLSSASTGRGVVGLIESTTEEASLSEKAAQNLLSQLGIATPIGYSSSDSITAVQQRIQEGPLTAETVEGIMLASDLLKDAGWGLNTTKKYTKKIGLVRIHTGEPAYQDLDKRGENLPALALGLMLFLRNRFLGDKPVNDPSLRLLGAETVFRWATALGAQIEQNGLQASREFRRDQLSDMISALEKHFLGAQGLIADQSLPRSTVRGKLFELDWVLDAAMHTFLKDDYDTQIIMASARSDSPRVGRPELNRGSDITIRNFQDNSEYFVQLKSSGQQRDKKYHPLIEVASEENFQDMNPGRLTNKLRAYRAFIASDHDPSLADEARRYILPSVIEVLERERQHHDSYDRLAGLHGVDPIRRSAGKPEYYVTINLGAATDPK